ncbi:hypothetical protein IW262DRAFT_1467278 [Armillaria fumosa]|nr:hypothetical protein IW262DRAFT_1467278 [Armillaria fumosa]
MPRTFARQLSHRRKKILFTPPAAPRARTATIPPPTPARKPSDEAVLLVAPGHPRYPSALDDDDAILQRPPPIRQMPPSPFRPTQPTQYQHERNRRRERASYASTTWNAPGDAISAAIWE